ncbi:ATP-binding cassette domain-containing protein [Marinobacterium sp. LSUCC0821]|uniref:ATP-binding cassette domain-containing protein n=1 Tax=Marinobacterium sp. LSUCC0821 TaxID=2668067 RepID=UPI00145123D7|nr:ATP-binding cassette domain-containing protein [Marinobacterium sp. LSUCC0821]QJD71659.1 ATP-binding cassette domain-containing protein [Marinobacterium sp. LSUCC0821]
MIRLDSLTLQRGAQRLIDHADLNLHYGWKVALIGANGAGKSSLFKLILGELSQDTGDITTPPRHKIAHMAQEVPSTDRRAIDYVLDGDLELRELQAKLAKAEAEHSTHIGELHAQIEAIDGYRAESRAFTLLNGLGFSNTDATKPVNTFSGGWRIRLNLAKALMSRSDLLLLDEPTNHLDLDATIWLEQWLNAYPGTLILISHDRSFIDATADQVVHLYQQKLTLYKGNYSAFERMRAERLAQQQAAFDKQQERIAHIESFVRRFKAKASKAKQAQSRIKDLERMEMISAAHIDSPFSFRFDASDKISSPLLNIYNADLGYGAESKILNGVSLTLVPGQRIGLLGRNGAGKSTLVKSLVGDLALISGERATGEHLKIGYFAQHQLEALDMNASVLLHLQRIAPKASEAELRSFAGSFGFSGDDALETIGRFSGGEKARLALALIAWHKPNLLLLDEPTNHLDLEVRHALTLALQGFEGSIILVSHDRHLLANTVDQFLLVAEGKVTEFDGDLDDYHQWLASQRQNQNAPAIESESRSQSAADRREQKRLEAEKRAKLSPLRKKIEKLEKEMHSSSEKLGELETLLSDTDLYSETRKDELKSLLAKQGELKSKLEEIELEWLDAQEELETLEQSL